MDILTFRHTYWNYYVQMESDFFSYSPYCEIDHCNDNAFSVKYLQLLLSICGEIDTICKRICKQLDNSLDINSCGIDDYIPIFNQNYPTFSKETVVISNYKYDEVMPWKSIEQGYTPDWWQAYNNVKHHRDEIRNGKENYKYANQKTVLRALCVLYVLIEYWAAQNFVTDKTDKMNNIMQNLKSTYLNMKKWNFYFSFMGQTPWFDSEVFYKYLNGGDKS